MIELAISIIILLWFLNRSSLLKGLKTHINMWSSSSTLEASLDYAKDIRKKTRKASPEELQLARNLLEGEEISFSSLLKDEKKKDSKESKLDDIISELTSGE